MLKAPPRPPMQENQTPLVSFFRQFRRVLLHCDQFDSAEQLASQIVDSLLDDGEHGLVRGGRIYRLDPLGLELIGKKGDAGDAPLGHRVARGFGPVQKLLQDGYFALEPDEYFALDEGTEDPPSEHGTRAPFAALVVGRNKEIAVGLALANLVSAHEIEPIIATLHSISEACWQRQSYSSELAQAAEVQTSLLSGALSEIPGFELAFEMRPAEIVGGDFIDVTQISNETWALAIGDATGHGLSAALQARDAVTGLRMGLELQLKISTMLWRLDRVLTRSGPSSRFVSLAYIELDRRGNIIFVNAGHPPPLILSPSTRNHRELHPTASLLGLPLPEQPRFARAFDRLEPDEILVAFTDGILEAESPEGEEFGLDRLKDLLFKHADRDLDELLETVLLAVDAFSPGRQQMDDQTLMLLRRDRT